MIPYELSSDELMEYPAGFDPDVAAKVAADIAHIDYDGFIAALEADKEEEAYWMYLFDKTHGEDAACCSNLYEAEDELAGAATS